MGRSIPAVVRQGTLCSISKENLIMAKKKGFMTPERKKKLRTLLRKKAAEELKKEQEQSRGETPCHCRALRNQGRHRQRLRRRPQEDLPGVLRQVVQVGGRDVLPPERGHPPRPPDQRAHHLRQ